VGEHRDFKFGVQIDHSKSQPTDYKQSLKGACSRHVTHFKLLIPLSIPGTAEQLKLEISKFVHWLIMWSISLRVDK